MSTGLLLNDVFYVGHDDESYDLLVIDVLHEHIERLQELPPYLSRCAELSAQANSHEFSSIAIHSGSAIETKKNNSGFERELHGAVAQNTQNALALEKLLKVI